MTRTAPTRTDASPGTLAGFVALAFLISWGVFSPVVLGFVPVERATPLAVASIFGPTAAALLVVGVWGGDLTGTPWLLAADQSR